MLHLGRLTCDTSWVMRIEPAPIEPTPQAIIFDLDGTLADTFPLIVAAWNAAMQKPLGRIFTPDEVIARFGIPDTAMLRRELPEGVWEEPDRVEAIETYHRHYEAEHLVVRPFDGIPALLQALHKSGLPLGLVTGKGRRTTAITLRQLGWDELLDAVVTGEDVTHQKPHPEGVLSAARQLGASPEQCVFVGDSPVDVQAGKSAGMVAVVAGWHSYYQERLRACQPDYWAATPNDIFRLCGGGK